MGNLEIDGSDAEACPFIGLADDPATRFTFPHPDHRCRAGVRPSPVVQAHQAKACLTRDFKSCQRYRSWLAPGSKPAHPAPAALGSKPAHPASSAPASQPVIHVCRAGDSLVRIAELYGISVEDLIAANGLLATAAVVDGQRLRIPLAPPPPPGR